VDCPVKCIIAGSRKFANKQAIFAAIESRPFIMEIVSGRGTGIDAVGELYAKTKNLPLQMFPADWRALGKSAGPIRNRKMSDYAEALIPIPVTSAREGGSGSWDMIGYAKRRGLRVFICPEPIALSLIGTLSHDAARLELF
jgi:hypothetical protein